MVKLGIVLFLLFIVYNLGMGCYHMLTDRGQSTKSVRSLTWRIGLSVLLVALIGWGIRSGVIQPHGVLPPH